MEAQFAPEMVEIWKPPRRGLYFFRSFAIVGCMFGLSRQQTIAVIAVFTMAIAVGALIISTFFTLPPIAALFLGLISILSSALAGIAISRDQLLVELNDRNKDKLRQVTAMAANELNNVYQTIAQLSRTWEFIAGQFKVEQSTRRSVQDSFDNIQLGVQNSIQSIIRMGPMEENPFLLYRFSTSTHCSDPSCHGIIVADDLAPYARSVQLASCPICKMSVRLRRRYDGSISAESHLRATYSTDTGASDGSSVAVPLRSPGLYPMRPPRKLIPFNINCPKCEVDLRISVNELYPYAKRGCPECGSVFRFDVETRVVTLLASNYNKIINNSDITFEYGKRQIQCDCGKAVGAKYFLTNSSGRRYVNCFYCGSLLFDDDQLLMDDPD